MPGVAFTTLRLAQQGLGSLTVRNVEQICARDPLIDHACFIDRLRGGLDPTQIEGDFTDMSKAMR
jgi:hypothetical protein